MDPLATGGGDETNHRSYNNRSARRTHIAMRIAPFMLALTFALAASACTPDSKDPLRHPSAPPESPAPVIDPQGVEVGDSLGRFVIERVALQRALDGEWVGSVDLAGTVELAGRYGPHPAYPEVDEVCFFPDDDPAEMLPRLPHDRRTAWFCFSNGAEAGEMLGAPPSAGRAQVSIDEYRYVFERTDAFNTARLSGAEPL